MLFFPVKMKVVHIVLFLVQYNYLSLLFSLFFFFGSLVLISADLLSLLAQSLWSPPTSSCKR